MKRILIWWVAFLTGAASALAQGQTLRLLVQNGYLPPVPVLVRVDVLHADGSKARELWDAEAVLTADQAGITLSTNRIALRNGVGSFLVTFSGGGDFNLTATVGALQATRPLTPLTNAPVTPTGGTLPGTSTTWSGVILITNDVTVPAGHTLTIQSNTLVLVNGVASGTTAPDILVNGTINSLGTEAYPVTITCASAALRWGQIRHNTAQPSLYRYTSITRAGSAPGEGGHTGTGPVIRPTNSRITFESCNITDHAEGSRSSPQFGTPGKIALATGSDLTFVDCLFQRARMGPEIQGTALLCTNSYIMDMLGPDDADGIYIHAQSGGQQCELKGCVLARGDDDGIDTLDSTVMVENCIIREWNNLLEDAKGISVFNGATHVKRCLIVDSTVGIAAKWSGGAATLVTINTSTLTANLTNVWANRKLNAPGPFVDFRITNCVLWGGDSVQSDFGPTNFTIRYCNISEPWPGTGNIMSDPLFVNAGAHDFHLQNSSPCIDAGDPASAPDPDGTRADMGAFPFYQAPLIQVQPQSQTVVVGTNVTFSVTAGGGAPLGYQWRFNGADITDATGSSFTLTNVQPANVGDYTVVVTNASGSITSQVAVLTVLGPPLITSQPQNQTVPQGQNATFTVTASGSPPLSYQWQSNDLDVINATNSSLIVPSVTGSQNGDVFRVVVSNAAGSTASDPATLFVTLPPPLTITTHPQSQTVLAGVTVTFSVTAGGSPPLNYQWRFKGTNIADATNSTLSLTNVQAVNEGAYDVVVRDSASGAATSNPATLTVLVPPAITQPPQSQSALVGSDVTFTVLADGTAPLHYRWRYNGGTIAGATNASLVRTNVQLFNAGNYTVVVTNSVGAVTSTVATLTVTDPNGTVVGGVLTSNTVWSPAMGMVLVLSNVTVPTNITLTIAAGTVVKTATNTSIRAIAGGVIDVQGTRSAPVTFQQLYGTNNWGEIAADGTNSFLTIRHAEIVGGAVKFRNGATGLMEDCYVHNYKSGTVPIAGCTNARSVTVRRCHFSYYHETLWQFTLILVEDSLFEYADNPSSDALDFDGAPPGCVIRRCTFRHGPQSNTDAIDLGSGSIGTIVEDCLMYDFPFDKGVSIGESSFGIIIRNCLMFGCDSGVAVKDSCTATIYQCTIVDNDFGFRNYNKANPASPTGGGHITNSYNNILWNNRTNISLLNASTLVAIYSDFGGINYPGTGNISADPLFVNEAQRDYHLASGSPCIGTGVGGANVGVLLPVGGIPLAPGTLTAVATSDTSVHLSWLDNSTYESGYELQRSADGVAWTTVLLSESDATGYDDLGLQTGATYHYRVRAKNVPGDSEFSNEVTVAPPMRPTITTEPQNQTAAPCGEATFSVVAAGLAPLSFQWLANGTNAPNATNAMLVIGGLQPADNGTAYAVVVSNLGGSVTSAPAVLTVTGDAVPPALTSQPQSQTVAAGTNITFSVSATGCEPLHYQWRLNGGDLAGETNATLALSNVQTADVGDYAVRVTDLNGNSTVSANATLTVRVPFRFEPGASGVNSSGAFQLQLSAPANASVVIEVSTNLLDWISVMTSSATGGVVSYVDPDAANFSRRFYRARLQP